MAGPEVGAGSPEAAEEAAPRVWPRLDEVALIFDGEPVTYRELLLVGAATGQLEPLVAQAALGDALARRSPEAIDGEAIRAEARKFRRARHLESGEDLRTWLAARALTLGDFEQYVTRRIAREGHRPDEPGPWDELDRRLVYSELAFGGGWRAFAGTAVRLFGAERIVRQGSPSQVAANQRRGAGEEATVRPTAGLSKILGIFDVFDQSWSSERLEVLAGRSRALEEVERQVWASERVGVLLEDRRLDWALFCYDELTLPSLTAAKEALSCARDDGLPADSIAKLSGSPLVAVRSRRDELPRGYGPLLEGAAEDEVVGPIENSQGFSVLWLRERARPGETDSEAAERAVAELVSEALERAVTGVVREAGQL